MSERRFSDDSPSDATGQHNSNPPSERRFISHEDEAKKVVGALVNSLSENDERKRVIEEQQRRIEELERELYTDEKTKVYNERAFHAKLPTLIEFAKNNNAPIALVLADTDGLKRTNEKAGHSAGDELLKATARALVSGSRSDDVVGRLSGDKGDEFYAILPGFAPSEGNSEQDLFDATVQKYRDAIGREIPTLGLPEELKVGVSFGVAYLSQEDLTDLGHLDPQELTKILIGRADEELVRNKHSLYQNLENEGVAFEDSRMS